VVKKYQKSAWATKLPILHELLFSESPVLSMANKPLSPIKPMEVRFMSYLYVFGPTIQLECFVRATPAWQYLLRAGSGCAAYKPNFFGPSLSFNTQL
jgi:hypothetical protein